jgi:hypothetical protein
VKAAGENFPPQRSAFAVGLFNSGSSLEAIFAPRPWWLSSNFGAGAHVRRRRRHGFHLDPNFYFELDL